jgi:hypothetical protein
VEVLGLEVQREHVGEDRVESAADVARRLRLEVGRRDERRLLPMLERRLLFVGAVLGHEFLRSACC